MDRFIINYNGNKYQETKKYLKEDIEKFNYDIVAEPFGGIYGFSRYYYLINDNEETQFYINDINEPLINFYKELKKDFDKTLKLYFDDFMNSKEYIENDKDNITKIVNCPIIKYASKHIGGLYTKKKLEPKIRNFKNKKEEYKKLFSRCKFYSMDADDFVNMLNKEKQKQKKKILIYYDPPYFDSNNSAYLNKNKRNSDKYLDNTTLYLDILNNMNNVNIDQIFIMNKLDIINHIFKDYHYKEYTGVYQNISKNKKHHIIYFKFKT